MTKYRGIFEQNIKRVDNMCMLYERVKSKGAEENTTGNTSIDGECLATDILRAAVVFLHSSFEEYFRCILIEWLPVKAPSEELKEIPLSIRAGKRAEKIYLSDLGQYKGRYIDDVIKESVAKELELRSFNNRGEITSWAHKMGLDVTKIKEMESVDKAVHRRHKIVHEADTAPDKNDKLRLKAINADTVRAWENAYCKLVGSIDAAVETWQNKISSEEDAE